jgi:hypothetical protein
MLGNIGDKIGVRIIEGVDLIVDFKWVFLHKN